MGRNVIVSEDTVRDLLEAHASLSAWYYELWTALRAANASTQAPDDAARRAFVERLVTDFPEVAAVAKTIRTPRLYVPAPPPARVGDVAGQVGHAGSDPEDLRSAALNIDEPATITEPAPARLRELGKASDVPPPPFVDPGTGKVSDVPPPLPLVDPGTGKVSDVPPPPPLVDPGAVKYGP